MTNPVLVPKDFWQDRRVLITGATGLVGSILTKDLIKQGADVITLVRDKVVGSEYHRESLHESCTEVRGELENFPLLVRTIAEYEIHTVIHLAAQTIVGIGVRSPLGTFEANIRGTYQLLEACRQNPTVQTIVVASSDKAYGEHKDLPYQESHSLLGNHPYDVSKACADLLCRAYFVTYQLPVAVARCANFYGGGDLNWNRIIPGTIRSALRGKSPEIRSDGTPIRDYLHIVDGARVYRILAEQMSTRPELHGEAFNFGNNDPKTVLEITKLTLKAMESNLKPVVLGEAKDEIQAQYLDSTKAKELLGWKPKYSLEAGLKQTIAWYRSYLGDNST
ncbi:GDP-mannose 4,6-dehydratase [Acidobacteria bacterium AH-259-L09]|nr:GDP-mannose 4,6-dehydratase [Acidobacteria bacterium AH-259-L09]